ncbi:hypothetical protein ABIA24_003385 [Sinorhizobium fredii]|uniref:hypothetical protein n=1 Tax=Rhizobium fredii TaxID=380 RepID=UPI0005669081|nr:hypothetical protein [Sinorhizobium fredii]
MTTRLSLNSVSTITATPEPGVFFVGCNITDINGETYDTEYCSRPDDPFGLNPTIRKWLADNASFPVQPHVPATPEELRAGMPRLTARQFRLGLVGAGLTPAQVSAVIEAMPAGQAKETALIEWEYATTFNRTHPLIASVGGALGLTDEQIDAMWAAALSL